MEDSSNPSTKEITKQVPPRKLIFRMMNARRLIPLLTLGSFLVLVQGQSVCTGTQGGSEYMCVDWSFGSELMSLAQYKHKLQSGEDILFGLGSYGSQRNYNIGKCYKFYLHHVPTPIIAQVTNYGADISDTQFDMQMGGGGFGVWNACSGPTDKTVSDSAPCNTDNYQDIPVWPQFNSAKSQWGKRCGGQTWRSGCDWLPKWPAGLSYTPKPSGSSRNEPNLQQLCQRSYDWGARVENGNRKITHGQRVPCPTPLIEITNLKRYDDHHSGGMASGTLTSTMDCCAPAGAYRGATGGNNLITGKDKLRPCKRDGYTRV